MQCPADRKNLELGTPEGHVGYLCKSCSGVWLPRKYIESIRLLRDDFVPADFYEQLAAGAVKGERQCPGQCGTLHSSNLYGLELDWCRDCDGLWFDGGELTRLLARHGPDPDSSRDVQHLIDLLVRIM